MMVRTMVMIFTTRMSRTLGPTSSKKALESLDTLGRPEALGSEEAPESSQAPGSVLVKAWPTPKTDTIQDVA